MNTEKEKDERRGLDDSCHGGRLPRRGASDASPPRRRTGDDGVLSGSAARLERQAAPFQGDASGEEEDTDAECQSDHTALLERRYFHQRRRMRRRRFRGVQPTAFQGVGSHEI
ncbi:hypothetical protein U1Q18_006802 [Sarracenia purpurea var. burkii]